MDKIIKFIVGTLILGVLTACQLSPGTPVKSPEVVGVILPHHLLVANYIDEVYSNLASQHNFEKIILLSPNHFGYGLGYIQSDDQPEIYGKLDTKQIDDLAAKHLLTVEPRYYKREHGIMNHFPFIKKYFPDAEVTPISIKPGTPASRLDLLINELNRQQKQPTLIIASIDFSHYIPEATALKNDNKIIAWLKDQTATKSAEAPSLNEIRQLAKTDTTFSKDATAIDSPESLYMLVSLLKKAEPALKFTLVRRTSSASITDSQDPLSNTSHIFGILQGK